MEQLKEWCRIADEMDAVAIAHIFGTTPGWVKLQVSGRKKGGAPRLVCKRTPGGGIVRRADNR